MFFSHVILIFVFFNISKRRDGFPWSLLEKIYFIKSHIWRYDLDRKINSKNNGAKMI